MKENETKWMHDHYITIHDVVNPESVDNNSCCHNDEAGSVCLPTTFAQLFLPQPSK